MNKNLSTIKPDKENLNTYLYSGSFLLLIATKFPFEKVKVQF